MRGPSGAGKSTVSRALRRSIGKGAALVEQDYVRRTLLWEKDRPGALNIAMLDSIVRLALDAGRHVVLEGILAADHYGAMMRALIDDHQGITVCAYLDVPFAETVRRHGTRSQSAEFTPTDMARWWDTDDKLGCEGEVVVGAASTVDETVASLLTAMGSASRI
ncbi:AAA family ATPase [Isoptericola sp. 4D.3]|uniref:AAA family ATPase n=1 Tax=Isoptericola peretonis TaxID=2918523 RepID=A0ABT0J431_9MICO|nr:AAA family ATPase [Isoptericola sp. 4D.3]